MTNPKPNFKDILIDRITDMRIREKRDGLEYIEKNLLKFSEELFDRLYGEKERRVL